MATVVAFTVAAHGAAQADAARKTHRSVPASVAHSAPDTTGAIPTTVQPGSPTTQPSPPAVDDAPLPPPFTLPKVARARMRACGHAWEARKQAGTTGDDIWRDFATKCLVAKDDPAIGADDVPDEAGGAPPPSR